MDVFSLRKNIIADYADYVRSFIEIRDTRIQSLVNEELEDGLLWPNPLIQLNPAFQMEGTIDELVADGLLHPTCSEIFRIGKSAEDPIGKPLSLYTHQVEAIRKAHAKKSYVLTTGTGSGKSLSYIIPIVNSILRHGSGSGIHAIIVYPMNALANSQEYELNKFLNFGKTTFPVTCKRYTGQESETDRKHIINDPPDIILTNYVMLELILTRPYEHKLVEAARNLKFLVFDELHTYRGRQGADVAMLIRRLKNTITRPGQADSLQYIGTSATLAGPGTFAEQQQEIATLSSKLFGTPISPDNIIVETLTNDTINTLNCPITDTSFKDALKADILSTDNSTSYASFIRRPLSVWIENTLGLATNSEGRLIRCTPKALEGDKGIATMLAKDTHLPYDLCLKTLKQTLLAGYQIKKPTGKPVFAFKLHQFLSKGDTVYASIAAPHARELTLEGQQYAPKRSDAKIPIFPLLFCRECGKEYYAVWRVSDPQQGTRFLPRPITGIENPIEGEKGFLFVQNPNDPESLWPESEDEQLKKIPEDWIEESSAGKRTVRKTYKKYLPTRFWIREDASLTNRLDKDGILVWYFPEPFTCCFACSVFYNPRLNTFSKLASLGNEGRSTATTILSMATVSHLREEKDLDAYAYKFLCFSDNRQDASLQSGHFNDFIEIGLIRSALYNALELAAPDGLHFDTLASKVFEALGKSFPNGVFPAERYSQNPNAKYSKAALVRDALYKVLEYRIYCDLKRGWRIVAPNLEQCGLLTIDYLDLDPICEDATLWAQNEILANLAPNLRKECCQTLLDFMRRRLCINVSVLDPDQQTKIKSQSKEHLLVPWAIDEYETMQYAGMLFAHAKSEQDTRSDIYLPPTGLYARWIKQKLSMLKNELTKETLQVLFHDLLTVLCDCGLLTAKHRDNAKEVGYQIMPSAMIWKVGDGTIAHHDTLRISHAKNHATRTNKFFVSLFKNAVKKNTNLYSHEHTAQVPANLREEREKDFRKATLPILYCSPTMELGVDIAQLNAVGMRNVPPTPANYAQRSGRAGRSGQPALIITYCAQGSSHDQHFFHSPEEMVAGSVQTPRIDLANEDLIRAHVHALWLAASKLDLKTSLKDLLDISGQKPSLALLDSVAHTLADPKPRDIALAQAKVMLESIADELTDCGWYTDSWLKDTIDAIPSQFELALERWRNLYRSTIEERDYQHNICSDALKSSSDKRRAQLNRKEAEEQLELLLGNTSRPISSGDFYSYRYFASEGFLPGYNFPRLPLSAYIPTSQKSGNNTYITRSRFLALAEFGPGSIIYHEGARFAVNRVKMSSKDIEGTGTTQLQQCPNCGSIHPVAPGKGMEFCQLCNTRLPAAFTNMFRMRNVETKQRDRISSDEEERLRYGYNLRFGFRFVEHGGIPSHRDAHVTDAKNNPLLLLQYGHGAELWRMNLGWIHSTNTALGFYLNVDTGCWQKQGSKSASKETLSDDPEAMLEEMKSEAHLVRVIPYVQDRKNCLRLVPDARLCLEKSQLLSLQEALKQAIQQYFQLEDAEIATETIPSIDDPKSFLFIESAEGGAGVLRHLVDDPLILPTIAKTALRLCHFDPKTGEDQKKAPHARENCVVACYDCLLNYSNQRIHSRLDRHGIKDVLLALTTSQIHTTSTKAKSRFERFTELKKCCDSKLEEQWLTMVYERGFKLPDAAQHPIKKCHTVCDFFYKPDKAIYIDGPVHDFSDKAQRDKEQEECLDNLGYPVYRFADWEQWEVLLRNNPEIFGEPKKS